MKRILIAGLGNPGPEYALTRHNIGFIIVDRLAEQLRLSGWTKEKKSHSIRGEYRDNEVIIIKPRTYMNLSGEAVIAYLSHYRIPPGDFLAVVDDLALPFGKLRFRARGSDGGHNGLSSIIEKIGSQEFPRLRVGIDPTPEGTDTADYVLSSFTPEQIEELQNITEKAVKGILSFIESGIEDTMNCFNKSS
ncbi:MAG: aminoacyl-tRNA hydrolase [Firmicutes bacterium]|nr:aminoacyl-tRNA hydrolase [Bacillota bacterium]